MKLKVGIIGLGVGQKHVEAFDSHPFCKVSAVSDFSEKKRKYFSVTYPDIKTVINADEILRDPNIDIVSIASYDNYHYEQIIKAISSNKHIFIEKPLCLFEKEAKEIRTLLNEHPHIKISSNLTLRTCPRFIRIKDAIHNGEMGSLFYLEGDYLWGRLSKITDGWRKDMEFYSIIYGAAIHMIDLILWMTGKRPVEVLAYGNNIATENSELKSNSFAVLLLKYENGMIAKVTGNGGCVHPHFHRLVIYGTKKTAIHDITSAIWLESSNPRVIPEIIDEEYPAKEYRNKVITSFVDHISNDNKASIVPSNDVFDVMSVCYAAERAINESNSIKIIYI